MLAVTIPTNAWGRVTVYGAERAQYQALEEHLLADWAIEYRQILGWRFKASYPCFERVIWEDNVITYDFEN